MEVIPDYPFMDRLPLMDIMANLPRVEITDKALKVLKIETAISGLNQKEALEALILRGASTRTLELVEGKAALEVMEEVEEKPLNPQMDKLECKKEGEAIICASLQVTPETRQALLFILGELEAGRRPTVQEVADHVGLTATGLARILTPFEIKAQKTHVNNQNVRIFNRTMKPKIEDILGKL